jgi:hypothetical protein
MSASAEHRLPWLYAYREDAQSTRLERPVYRPFVPISLVHDDRSTWQLTGLIDTGADSVLASNLIADQLGVDLEDHDGTVTHAVGGRTITAHYKTVGLRLHPRDAEEDEYVEWETQVGFVEGWHSDGLVLLGSIGFLDRFTVTASRFTQAVAVEDQDAFDRRFGIVPPTCIH